MIKPYFCIMFLYLCYMLPLNANQKRHSPYGNLNNVLRRGFQNGPFIFRLKIGHIRFHAKMGLVAFLYRIFMVSQGLKWPICKENLNGPFLTAEFKS